MNKGIQVAIIVTLLLIGFSVFYHFVIFLPKQAELKRAEQYQHRQEQQKLADQHRQEQQKLADQHNKETQLSSCLNTAEEQYQSNWDMVCRNLGRSDKCVLPEILAADLNNQLNENKGNCANLYK